LPGFLFLQLHDAVELGAALPGTKGVGSQVGFIFSAGSSQGYAEFDGHDRPSGWNGMKRILGGLSSRLGPLILFLISAPLLAQTLPPLLPFPYQTQPTAKDVDPGIDHGNSGANLPEEFQKRLVFYRSQQPPGTIIVNTLERHLYVIQDPTHAMRYGIGVGRDGFTWQGLLQISRKAEWPDWHPPPEMIERQPYLPRFMAGGPGNPLGARAMYLGTTVYRIHGTNAPETIGQAVSSGCFRLVNEDVMDLYDRVNVGTKVIVRQD
jgi:lipoprotein-anchoring transpeptidase ErfK/SrfK